MERWNVQQRVTCVRSYYKAKSVTEEQRVFRRQFNVGRHGRVPSRNTILAWVKKFDETGSVFAVKHGAPRIVRTPENLQRMREAFEHSPRCSARQHSRILGVSRKSLFPNAQRDQISPLQIASCATT